MSAPSSPQAPQEMRAASRSALQTSGPGAGPLRWLGGRPCPLRSDLPCAACPCSASQSAPAAPPKLLNGGLTAWWRQANGGGASPGRVSWDGAVSLPLPWALPLGPPELLAPPDPALGGLVDPPGHLVEVALKVGSRRRRRGSPPAEGKASTRGAASEKAGLPPIPTAGPAHRRLWSFGSMLEGYESETAAWASGEAGSRTGSRNPSESGSVSTGEAEVRLGVAPAEGDPDSPGAENSARVVPTCSSDTEGERTGRRCGGLRGPSGRLRGKMVGCGKMVSEPCLELDQIARAFCNGREACVAPVFSG